jgi:hypothetical protein
MATLAEIPALVSGKIVDTAPWSQLGSAEVLGLKVSLMAEGCLSEVRVPKAQVSLLEPKDGDHVTWVVQYRPYSFNGRGGVTVSFLRPATAQQVAALAPAAATSNK